MLQADVFHLAGTDAVSRHELGILIARRDGIAPPGCPPAGAWTAASQEPSTYASTAQPHSAGSAPGSAAPESSSARTKVEPQPMKPSTTLRSSGVLEKIERALKD
ncbi:hypothetical protein GCM10009654_57510 [Streptomyces hebeiensis]|uniref:Uncharacterized protein n=1 Tax=Streptomyces hebeiensis TaxID=229486 RepID=A0ABN1V5Q0_9ACTN